VDLVKMLNWDISPISLPKQIKLFEELPKEHQKVVDYLQKQQQVIDVIALDLEMSVSNLATILLQLELKGIVKPIQGKIFKLS
jgi:DNA processing protein